MHPAILYCLATIDLLWTVTGGTSFSYKPHPKGGSTVIPQEILYLIWSHLWPGDMCNEYDHLILRDLPTDSKISIKIWSVEIHQVFTLGITQLKEDIKESLVKHGGYLDQLDINYDNLLDKFEKAIMEAYTP